MATGDNCGEGRWKIAIIGSGLVGKSFAMLFASSGHDVKLYDISSDNLQRAVDDIQTQLSELFDAGLQRGSLTLTQIVSHITMATNLKECVQGANFIQECVPENRELKRSVWKEIDDIIESRDVVLGSSTSAIVPSLLSDHLKHKERFMVAHPANPPFLNPMVELVPAPWTQPAAIEWTRVLMEGTGQVPVVLKREIEGFVQARIQAAILHVAWQLTTEDYVGVLGLETAMHEGLGGWYSFMGPFSSEHLNADGFVDLMKKYGQGAEQVIKSFPSSELMQGPKVAKLAHALAQWTPRDRLDERIRWRDRRMAALLKLRHRLDEEDREAESAVTKEQ